MNEFIQQKGFQKVFSLVVLVGLLFLMRDVLNILLFTFLFAFLFYTFKTFIEKKTGLSPLLSLIVVYLTFIGFLSIIVLKYSPVIISEITDIINLVINFDITMHKDLFPERVYEFLLTLDLMSYVEAGGKEILGGLAGLGGLALEVFIGITLSFFLLLEIPKIQAFLSRFETSNVAFLYSHIKNFGTTFVKTFGQVIQVQMSIATVNAILSFFGLWILGFPNLFGLTIMIFFLGLIPVAGVMISFIPLSIIAFNIGGTTTIIYLVLMVLFIHAVENYFLNPKLYSLKMKLPIFFTFSVLIISEHLMGVWGLLLGIPTFMFLLDLMGITKDSKASKGSDETKDKPSKDKK